MNIYKFPPSDSEIGGNLTQELLRTYIEGLDEELGGGIQKGHVVLVSGTPGTMKSSSILYMMYQNQPLEP